MVPENLRYTAQHEWAAPGDGGTVRVGITDYAQDALGDIVYVQLAEPGSAVKAGESLGEVESTKSVSEIYAPITGEVLSRNDELVAHPELVNTDPYGGGWMVEIAPADPNAIDGLLDATGYQKLIEA